MSQLASGPILSTSGLCKSYAAPVLRDISLDLNPGEVHALMGANGAGKSTLARILAGLTRPDQGTAQLEGRPYAPATKAEAAACGVQLVLQELNIIPTLSVAENLFLDRLPSRFGILNTRKLHAEARRILADFGLGSLDPRAQAGTLGVGEQQLLEIAGVLDRPCRVLILDEPTAALTAPQVDLLFRHIDRLKQAGTAMVLVSHRLDDIRRVADRVSVLRDGRLVATRPAAGLQMDEIVRLMVGAELDLDHARNHAATFGSQALRVDGLSRGDRVRNVSFSVREGEVFGLAGLVGSGRTELLRALYGADIAESGQLLLGDDPTPRCFRSPKQAVAAGLGLVPEDRKSQGLLISLSSRVNLTLPRLSRYTRPFPWIDQKSERASANKIADSLQVVARSVDQPVEELSGGNQQKIVLGRWLLQDPRVLLLDEPTRGIDIAARRAIYQLIDALARRGKAIVLVSSDLEELMSLSDRIGVLSAGRLVATFDRDQFSHEALLAAAFEGHQLSPARPETHS